MKVFLSWSGDRSRLVAEALRDWLPHVIQAVSPWISSSDIEIGARWANELALQLEQSRVGIICLTPENLSAPWLLYEAGALSKALEPTFVCPYLFGFSPSALTGPLVQFQAATATRDGTYALVRMLNRALGETALEARILDTGFAHLWPTLEQIFQSISARGPNAETAPKSAQVHSPSAKTDTPQLTGLSFQICPDCGGQMELLGPLPYPASRKTSARYDTS